MRARLEGCRFRKLRGVDFRKFWPLIRWLRCGRIVKARYACA